METRIDRSVEAGGRGVIMKREERREAVIKAAMTFTNGNRKMAERTVARIERATGSLPRIK